MAKLHLVQAAALLAVVCFGVGAQTQTQTQTEPPNFFILKPGSQESAPGKIFLSKGQTYSVSKGSNVTLGCQYTEPRWSTTIGKWSSTNSQLLPMIYNGYSTRDFAKLLDQYPTLASHISSNNYYNSINPVIVYLRLTNVQQQDMGQYGCFSAFNQITPTANITLALNQDELYIYSVRAESADQQVIVPLNSSSQAYACSVYRSLSSSPDYTVLFGKCSWSGLGQDLGNAARTVRCNGDASAYSVRSATQIASGVGRISAATGSDTIRVDAFPMPAGKYFGSTFWQKSYVRDRYSVSLSGQTIHADWLNKSLGCFAFINATNALYRDYVTFVQPDVVGLKARRT